MKKLITSILIITASAFAFAEEVQISNGIIIQTKTDPFEDSEQTTYILPANGINYNDLTQGLAVACENGEFTGMVVLFDGYLSSGKFGTFKYRVDSKDPVTIVVYMEDSSIVFGPRVNEEFMKDMLSGEKLVVRATAHDRDTYTSEYDLTNLKQTVTACPLPVDVLSER